MKGFFIKSTNITPSVYFNPYKSILDIRGKSSIENSTIFYNHIISNLSQYLLLDNTSITANFAFVYFNTNSSKNIFMILELLDLLSNANIKVTANWYYEDDDMLEIGEDMVSHFNIKFKMISVESIKVLGVE